MIAPHKSESDLQKNTVSFFRIVGYGISGCDPKIMGIGPVPAIRAMMAKTGKSLSDVDQLEINEAFGAQALSCLKELDAVPMDKGSRSIQIMQY